MPLLAQLMASLMGSIASFFGLSLAKKTVFAATAIAAGLVLTTGFVLFVKGLLVGIVYVYPAWGGTWMYAAIPSNAPACIGAYMSARMAAFIYRYNMENLKLASYIT